VSIVLRPRWAVVLGIGGCAALFGAAALYFHGNRAFGLLAYIAGFSAYYAVLTRLTKVTIIDEGLMLKAGYTGGLFCQWSEIVAVERRHLGPFRLDQLVLREPVRAHLRSNRWAPPEVTWRPTRSKRMFIGLYDKNWRTGPIGAAMTAHGVSLVAITPTPKPAVN